MGIPMGHGLLDSEVATLLLATLPLGCLLLAPLLAMWSQADVSPALKET